MRKLVFATNNQHKLNEISAIVPPGFDIVGLQDIGCNEEIIESADTLEGNADIKSKYVFEQYGLECFADDTGLEVESLGGRPGVYSARYAGEEGDADKNIDKLLMEMSGVKNRKARFRTIISLVLNGKIKHFEGIVNGHIVDERKGMDGFGYDPVFMPDKYAQTFAEMPLELKNSISHRGMATRKLVEYLKTL
jgi:XTP/dITP diphosphohydrolase